jgi:hypothetical protein
MAPEPIPPRRRNPVLRLHAILCARNRRPRSERERTDKTAVLRRKCGENAHSCGGKYVKKPLFHTFRVRRLFVASMLSCSFYGGSGHADSVAVGDPHFAGWGWTKKFERLPRQSRDPRSSTSSKCATLARESRVY